MKKPFLPLLTMICISLLALSCSANTINDCRNAFEKEDYATAKNNCSALVKKDPKNNDARLYLAKIYAITNNLELSLSECKKIYETEKDSDLGKRAKELENKIKLLQMIAKAKQRKVNRTTRDITTGALSCKESKDFTTLTCKFPCDGKLVLDVRDKMVSMSYPDGETIEEHKNGTYTINRKGIEITSNGLMIPPERHFRKSCNIEKDGSTYIVRNNGTKEYIYKDGTRKEILASGQVLRYTKDGSMKIEKPPTR